MSACVLIVVPKPSPGRRALKLHGNSRAVFKFETPVFGDSHFAEAARGRAFNLLGEVESRALLHRQVGDVHGLPLAQIVLFGNDCIEAFARNRNRENVELFAVDSYAFDCSGVFLKHEFCEVKHSAVLAPPENGNALGVKFRSAGGVAEIPVFANPEMLRPAVFERNEHACAGVVGILQVVRDRAQNVDVFAANTFARQIGFQRRRYRNSRRAVDARLREIVLHSAKLYNSLGEVFIRRNAALRAVGRNVCAFGNVDRVRAVPLGGDFRLYRHRHRHAFFHTDFGGYAARVCSLMPALPRKLGFGLAVECEVSEQSAV